MASVGHEPNELVKMTQGNLEVKLEPMSLVEVKTEYSEIVEMKTEPEIQLEEFEEKFSDQLPFVCDGIIENENPLEDCSADTMDMPSTSRDSDSLCDQYRTEESLYSNSDIPEKKQIDGKRYNCSHCDYGSHRMDTLTRHLRTHTGERPFLCKYCSCTFAQKSHVVLHERSHTGEKPYVCDTCGYRCSLKSYLVKHKRSHTGEKPFKCNLCEFRCSQSSSLIIHTRTHSVEKPFKCSFCSYETVQRGHLKRHMEKKHN